MTPKELRHVLEAAFLSVFPDATERELTRFDFGVAVGVVLGSLPKDAFQGITAEDAKAIVKNLYTTKGNRELLS